MIRTSTILIALVTLSTLGQEKELPDTVKTVKTPVVMKGIYGKSHVPLVIPFDAETVLLTNGWMTATRQIVSLSPTSAVFNVDAPCTIPLSEFTRFLGSNGLFICAAEIKTSLIGAAHLNVLFQDRTGSVGFISVGGYSRGTNEWKQVDLKTELSRIPHVQRLWLSLEVTGTGQVSIRNVKTFYEKME